MSRNYHYALRIAQTGAMEYLPESAQIIEANLTADVTLSRAVDSDVWDIFGDGKARPAPLDLAFDFFGRTEDEARVKLAQFYDLVKVSDRIYRNGDWYRDIHPVCSIVLTPIESNSANWRARFTLYPKGPRWLNAHGQSGVF